MNHFPHHPKALVVVISPHALRVFMPGIGWQLLQAKTFAPCLMVLPVGGCLAPIYRRERRFFEICMPGVRLRNSGSNVGPTSLLQMLIREMGKGEDGRY